MAALGSAAINDCKEGLALVAITPPPKGQRERPKNYSHNKANAALQQPQLQACEKAAPQQPQQDRNNGQHCNSANKAHAQPVRGATLTDDQLRQAVRLQPEEVGQFRELFQQATSNADKLHGQVAVAFLKRTGLPHVALKSIWEICDRNGKGHLTRSEFVLAARLVALAQVGMRPTLEQMLAYKQRFPTPKFELPDNIYTDDFDVTEAERATKHEYDVAKGNWRRTLVNVVIERQAFAEGAMRAAYHMRDLSASGEESRYVAKISKVSGTLPSQYFDDVRMQSESQKWAHDFNSRGVPKRVEFIGAYVMELIDRESRPICGVERFVPGQYVKYNNNWDWSDDRRNTPQAFSHFTWEASNHQLLICDIQGVADMYTDPQIHSMSAQGYGQGNLGMRGITKFLESHTCNHICRFLGLPAKAGKFQNAGTVVPGVRAGAGKKDVGTNINDKAMAPAKMEQVVQDLQLQWQQELMGLQQQAHNIAQIKLEAERRKMQQQHLFELKDQQRILEQERQRLEAEKQKWLESEKKKLGEQMEHRLEREHRRVEQQALGQFVAVEGPLDRPAHATLRGPGTVFAQRVHQPQFQQTSAAHLQAGECGAAVPVYVLNGNGHITDGMHDMHGTLVQDMLNAVPEHWVSFDIAETDAAHLTAWQHPHSTNSAGSDNSKGQSGGHTSHLAATNNPAAQRCVDSLARGAGGLQEVVTAISLKGPFGGCNSTFGHGGSAREIGSTPPGGAAAGHMRNSSMDLSLRKASIELPSVELPSVELPSGLAAAGHKRNGSMDLLLRKASMELDSLTFSNSKTRAPTEALDGFASLDVARILSTTSAKS